MGPSDPLKNPVIFFDGVCNLCNRSVLFIIKRDPRRIFRFAPLQSVYGRNQLSALGIDSQKPQSIVLLSEGKIFEKSRAALEITRKLNALWPLLYVLVLVPAFLRDWVYDLIATNRYKLFGKKDQCMIPTTELKTLFID